MMPKVAVVMGSLSDFEVMKAAIEALQEFNIDYQVEVISAHRSPQRAIEFAKTAPAEGIEVIIAGAGGSAHLPGILAALTTIPVIGVPIRGVALNGLDALLSIVQMPGGVPVATMGINNSKNAAIFAAQILSLKYPQLKDKLSDYKQKLVENVEAQDRKLKEDERR